MKLAVLADVHSNVAALERVSDHLARWGPDRVVLVGDVINRGPRPRACLAYVQQKVAGDGWELVRGNHEDYVLLHADPASPRSGPQFEIFRNSFWTYLQVADQVEYLASMPEQVSFDDPGGGETRFVHGSMQGPRAGIFPSISDETLRAKIAPPPATLCVGHTHVPLVKRLDGTLVVNVGSVGVPFDRDRRAAYAQLLWRRGRWEAEIVRLDYDWAQTEREFSETGFLSGAGPLAEIMLLEFQQARSHIHLWIGRYEQAILAGELSVAESVAAYLGSLGGRR